MQLRLPAVFAALLVLLVAPSSASAEVASADVVTKLNALRAEHGFPATVAENPVLTAGCLAHNQWMQLNSLLAHFETPGTPGYTEAGDALAKVAVLSMGATWEHGTPWRNAPIHLADTLMPQMSETGASEAFGYSCLATHTTTNLRAAQPAKATFWAYPRSGGSVPSIQTAFEAPAPPQTFGVAPITAGVPTGPNLLTFLRGPQFAGSSKPLLTAARLTGPRGVLVPTMTVNERQLPYLPPGAGVVVPRLPLTAGARYTWTATYTAPRAGGRPAFRFTSPPRTFTATQQQLCGAGAGGWFLPGSCPVSVRAVSVPRTVRLAVASTRGIRLGVTLDGTGWTGAVLKSGRTPIGTGSVTVGATQRGSIVVLPSRVALRRALGRRASAVLWLEVKASSTLVRRVRVTLLR